MNINSSCILIILIFSISCVSNKKLVYLQNKETSLSDTLLRQRSTRLEYQIQTNDILSISILSYDEKVMSIFNQHKAAGLLQQASTLGGGDIFYIEGYSVDSYGFIELPVVGKLKVARLTVQEVKLLVEENINKYYNNTFVIVKLGGIRFSVIGEVQRPGKFVSLQNQLNIFEALANAGDLTMVANRMEVKVIRQHSNGPKIYTVDLTDKEIIHSPYYYIQPNDVVYVKPLKVKSLGTGVTGLSTFQTVVSVLSAIALIITISK